MLDKTLNTPTLYFIEHCCLTCPRVLGPRVWTQHLVPTMSALTTNPMMPPKKMNTSHTPPLWPRWWMQSSLTTPRKSKSPSLTKLHWSTWRHPPPSLINQQKKKLSPIATKSQSPTLPSKEVSTCLVQRLPAMSLSILRVTPTIPKSGPTYK